MENLIITCEANKTTSTIYKEISARDRTIERLRESLLRIYQHLESSTELKIPKYSDLDLSNIAIKYADVAIFLNSNVFALTIILYNTYENNLNELLENFEHITQIALETSYIVPPGKANEKRMPLYKETILRYLRHICCE